MKLHKSIGSDTKNKQTHLTQKETRMHIFNLFHIYKQSNDLLSTHLFVTPIMLSRIKSIYFFENFFLLSSHCITWNDEIVPELR